MTSRANAFRSVWLECVLGSSCYDRIPTARTREL